MRARFRIAMAPAIFVAGCSLLPDEHQVLRPPSTVASPPAEPEDSGPSFRTLSTLTWIKNRRTPWDDHAITFQWGPAPANVEPPPFDRDRLDAAQNDTNPIVAQNAAILLARQGESQVAPILESLIRDPSPTLARSTRAAAAEALAHLPQTDPVATLRTLYRDLDHPDGAVPSALLRGMSRHVSPAVEPLFLEALESPHGAVRRSAVEAWQWSKEPSPPRRVLQLINDPDPQVRIAVIELLGAKPNAASPGLLETALRDPNRTVREFATASLGRLGSSEAIEILKRRAAEGPELDRAAAVRALAIADQNTPVFQAAQDSRWRVRQAAALSLTRFPERKTVAIARRLITDQSMQVQSAAAQAIVDWPDELAVPVLLEALEGGGYRTKTEAFAQLQSRTDTNLLPPLTPSPAAWRELAAQMRREWETQREAETFEQRPTPQQTALEAPLEGTLGRQVRIELERLDDPDARITRHAVERLVAFGPAALPAIHRWIEGQPHPLPEPLVSQVLPRISPLYATIEGLSEDRGPLRQKAAGDLRRRVEQQALARWTGEKLVAHLSVEDDPYVWQEVLKALELDHVPLAQQAAQIGLGHPRGEVRRQSCALFARHPHPQQVAGLESLLRDEHPSVQRAAVEALGVSRNPESAAALAPLLTHPSKSLRLATAKALARLADERGRDELTRLAYDQDPEVRRQAVLAMGEVGDPSFVPTLIAKLDDRRSGVRRATLSSLQTLAGSTPEAVAKSADPARQSEAWKRWWTDRNAGVAAKGQRAPR